MHLRVVDGEGVIEYLFFAQVMQIDQNEDKRKETDGKESQTQFTLKCFRQQSFE